MNKLVILDWYGTLYQRDMGPFPDSLSTLQELETRGYKFGLVSKTKNPDKVKRELRGSGLEEFFDENHTILADKKEAQQYLNIMHQTGANNNTTSIVGDRAAEDREIHIGNSLNCSTYWIQRGEYAHEIPTEITGQPTAIIKTASDSLDYLK